MCIQVCVCVCVCVCCAAAWMKAGVFHCYVGILLLDSSPVALYRRIVKGLAVFPASISFHFLLGAPSLKPGCLHFLLLVSALFASLLPKGTTELLKGPFELFVQWMKSSFGTVTGTAHASNWSLTHAFWLLPLLISEATWDVGFVGVSRCLTFSTPFYHAFWKILPPNRLHL